MRLDLLAEHYRKYFASCQPEVKREEEIINDVIVKNPFVSTEEIFEDVLPNVKANKFYAISYLGSQGNGKSYSAAGFATLAKKAGFLVIYGKAEDILIDLQMWIDKVKDLILAHNDPRVCFVLDDMSYAAGMISSKKAAAFKHFVGDIRHVFENIVGKVNIFIIYISHRFHSLPPMLRSSGSWIFASMLPEDRSDAMKMIPKQKDERMKLESLYIFLQKVTNDGPKFTDLQFNVGGNEFNFKWGNEEEPGDGRIMMLFHRGVLRLFNPREIEGMIDLEDYRIHYIPPPEPTEEQITEKIRQKAAELFPVGKDLNLDKPESEELITS